MKESQEMVIAKVKVVVLTGTRDGVTVWEGHMGKGFWGAGRVYS